MAHKLDMSNGRANIAYFGEKPWHGMGQSVIDPRQPIEQWAADAGMEWSAIRVPVGYKVGNDWKQQDGQWAIVRDDTFAHLGTFSDRYKIHQPTQILEFFRDFLLTDDRFTMETAGCLKGGAVVWGLAKFAEDMNVMGEKHCPYVMLTTSFDGSSATKAQATMIRVVCNNTLTAALYDKKASVSVRHSANWNEVQAARAHAQLEQVASGFESYKAMAEALATQRMARHQAETFFKQLTGFVEPKEGEKPSARKTNIIADLMSAYETTEAEGTEKGNAWTVLNAVTRFVDHGRATRVTGQDDAASQRMASKLFGSGSILKGKALEMLQAA